MRRPLFWTVLGLSAGVGAAMLPAQESPPVAPGAAILGAPALEAALAAGACLDLPWPESAGLSDRVLSDRCEVTEAGELPSAGDTRWMWALLRHETVYGATPDTPAEDRDLFPDTVPEAELVLFVGRSGTTEVRPAWHDRVETTFEVLRPPRTASDSGGVLLLLHRRCVSGTGGCLDHAYRLAEHGLVVPLVPRFREELRARLPEGWGTWKGVWLDPAAWAAEAPVYIPGDANCCPSLRAVVRLGLAGDTLYADSVAVVPDTLSETWRVLPGERFGPVDGETSEADLRQRLGPLAVVADEVYLAEGVCTPGTRVFPDQEYEIEVAWTDSSRTRPAWVRSQRAAGPWRTQAGVRVGTTLAELERLRGAPIEFLGFGWDYGGGARWEEGAGTLQLVLAIDRASDDLLSDLARTDPRVDEIDGDRMLRSDHPIIRQIQVRVERISLAWGRARIQRDCEEWPPEPWSE